MGTEANNLTGSDGRERLGFVLDRVNRLKERLERAWENDRELDISKAAAINADITNINDWLRNIEEGNGA